MGIRSKPTFRLLAANMAPPWAKYNEPGPKQFTAVALRAASGLFPGETGSDGVIARIV